MTTSISKLSVSVSVLAVASLSATSVPTSANPITRTVPAVAKCAKAKPCRKAAERQMSEWCDGVVRRTEFVVDFVNDSLDAIGRGLDAAKKSYGRAAKARRADEIHALHSEARSLQTRK